MLPAKSQGSAKQGEASSLGSVQQLGPEASSDEVVGRPWCSLLPGQAQAYKVLCLTESTKVSGNSRL